MQHGNMRTVHVTNILLHGYHMRSIETHPLCAVQRTACEVTEDFCFFKLGGEADRHGRCYFCSGVQQSDCSPNCVICGEKGPETLAENRLFQGKTQGAFLFALCLTDIVYEYCLSIDSNICCMHS